MPNTSNFCGHRETHAFIALAICNRAAGFTVFVFVWPCSALMPSLASSPGLHSFIPLSEMSPAQSSTCAS